MAVPAGQNAQFKRRGDVVRRPRKKQRVRNNMFDLQEAFEVNAGTFGNRITGLKIVPFSPAGDEVAGHFRVTITELQSVAWAEPVRGPRLDSLSFTPNPISDEVVLVGVQVAVEKFVIKEPASVTA